MVEFAICADGVGERGGVVFAIWADGIEDGGGDCYWMDHKSGVEGRERRVGFE